MSEYFRELGREKGLPVGAPQEFDATYYRHQLAGGMVSTTRRMLEEQRRPELFDAVLEEVGRVRAEMGYPIIVTPVSQLVATQAVRNVIDGERWANVSVETIRYFLGHYGEPAAPVAADVAERVLSRAGVEELRKLEPVHLEGARERFGRGISDEELLLRLTMPEEQVDAIVASPPASGRRAAGQPLPGGDAPAGGREAQVGHTPSRAEGGRRGGVAPCDLTTPPASSSTSTGRSCTGPATSSTSSPGRPRSWPGSAPLAGPSRSSPTAPTSRPRHSPPACVLPASTSPTTSCSRPCRACAPTWTRTASTAACS